MKGMSIKAMYFRFVSFCISCLLFLSTFGEKLMPCPDCGQSVSKRALMCPKCGCKGDVIEQVAKDMQKKINPKNNKPHDSWVVADIGVDSFRALPVRMNDGKFVVMPLEKTFGLETLVFSYATTNLTISYGSPEVATDAPLIRFPISCTNLQFAAATTNVYSELADSKSVKISDAFNWLKIQPKALKNHGRILLDIKEGKDVRLPKTAHPYYKILESKWKKKGTEL
jgi:hypothetical protein